MNFIDNFKFNDFQVSEEVKNILKNSTTNFLGQASTWLTNFLTSVITKVSSITTIVIYVIITILATYFICADRIYILDQIEHHFPTEWVKKVGKNIRKIIKLLGRIFESTGNTYFN